MFMTIVPEILRESMLAMTAIMGVDLSAVLVPFRETVFGLLMVMFLIFEPHGLAQIWRRIVHAITALGATIATGRARATEEELVWSVHVDMTGPASYSGSKQAEGFKDYVEWINARGGIRGHKVKLLLSDTTFQPAVALAGFKKVLAETKPVFVFGDSTAMIQAVTPENNSTHKILMTSGSLATEFDDRAKFPYHFMADSPYGTQLELLQRHIKQSHKGTAPAAVAIVHSSIPLGRDSIDHARDIAG